MSTKGFDFFHMVFVDGKRDFPLNQTLVFKFEAHETLKLNLGKLYLL